jgi:uncharacterized membrane protein (UPF0127 family)
VKYAQMEVNNAPLDLNIEFAASFGKRFLGLMFRKQMPEDHALLLVPCNAIHTFSMRFPIDVVYIGADGVIVKIEEAVKPGKLCKKVADAKCVLELCAHAANKMGLTVGSKIDIKQ